MNKVSIVLAWNWSHQQCKSGTLPREDNKFLIRMSFWQLIIAVRANIQTAARMLLLAYMENESKM